MLKFKNYLVEQELLNEKLLLINNGKKYGQIVFLAGGAGCHAKGTEVLMYDGSYKKVEDVQVNDILMGVDSTQRIVETLHTGRSKMLEVESNKGDSYICNYNHIHSFVASYNKNGLVADQIYNMTFDEYNQLSQTKQNVLKLYKSDAIVFETDAYSFDINPWLIGFWIGDGTRKTPNFTIQSDSPLIEHIKDNYGIGIYNFNECKKVKPNCQNYSLTTQNQQDNPFLNYVREYCEVNNEKRIPKELLTSSIENRKSVLAGLIDSDGYNNNGYYEIITKWESLKDDIEFLCGSLGYRTKTTIKKVDWNGEIREYQRISISGNFEDLPIQLDYKKPIQQKNKDPLRMNFNISVLEEGEYFGFSIKEDDKRFILKNWLVNHNSGKGFAGTNFMNIQDFKVRDVDEMKKAYLSINKLKHTYPELDGLDLRKPEDVGTLHAFIKKKGTVKSTLDNMLSATVNPEILPNIVFDVTLQYIAKIDDTVPLLIEAGYKPENIHIIWVLTDYDIAFKANQERDRIVPYGKDGTPNIILDTHVGASKTMWDIVGKNKIPKSINGGIYVILNNRDQTVVFKQGDKKDFRTAKDDKNALPIKTTSARKYLKKGDENFKKKTIIIKDFTYLTYKKPGKSPNNDKEIYKQLFGWVTKNIPKSALKNIN